MVTFDRGDTPTVAISHETLVREWPQMARWIDDARDDLVAQRRLSEASSAWDDEGRPDELLFGSTLVARYDDRPGAWATQADEEFLAASRDHVVGGQRRRRRARVAVATVLLAATAVAIVFAVRAAEDRRDAQAQRDAADAQRTVSENRALANEALLQTQGDPTLGLLLAIEAHAADPDPASLRPLLAALGRFPAPPAIIDDYRHPNGEVMLGLFGEGPISAKFACVSVPRPGTFVSTTTVAGGRGTIATVDAVTGVGSVVQGPAACGLAVNTDLTIGVGTKQLYGETQVVDPGSGDTLAVSDEIHSGTLLPDGRVLGFASTVPEGRWAEGEVSDRAALIWSDTTLEPMDVTDVVAVAAYPDPLGRFVVLSDRPPRADGTSAIDKVHRVVVDAADLSVVHDLGPTERTNSRVEWSADGTMFGDISVSGRLRVWDAITGELVADAPIGEDTSRGAWVAFSPSGQQIAVVHASGDVTVRPIGDPSRLDIEVRRVSGTTALGAAAASFIDSETLAVLLADGTVEITDLRSTALELERTEREIAGAPVIASATTDSGRVLGLTADFELVDRGDPSVRASPFTGAAPASFDDAGIVATPDGTVRAWRADLGAQTIGGRLDIVTVDGATLEATEPVSIELLPGTNVAAGLRDRVVAQDAAGTIFQFDYDGTGRPQRVGLSFAVSSIAQSVTTSRAIVAGSDRLAVIDLDTGEVFAVVDVNATAPLAMVSEDQALVSRSGGGDIELWALDGLAAIGPVVPGEKRGRSESIDVAGGALWYHTETASVRLTVDPEAMVETACDLAPRSLTADEWSRYVSPDERLDPTC